MCGALRSGLSISLFSCTYWSRTVSGMMSGGAAVDSESCGRRAEAAGRVVVATAVLARAPARHRYDSGADAAGSEARVRLARLTPRARPARPRRACGCAAQSDAPLPPTRALRRHTPGALWDRLADGTVGCVACAW